MSNFYDAISDVLNEKGLTIKDLERDKIIAKRSFYNFSKQDPSLKLLLSIDMHLLPKMS